MSHLPRVPSRHSAVRVPRNQMWKGAAGRWGMSAAFPPDALPLRAVATTRRRPPQRPNGTPRSNVGRKLSVRKRTCTAHANCSGSPARIIFGEISGGTRRFKHSEFAAEATAAQRDAIALRLLHPSRHRNPSSHTTASLGSPRSIYSNHTGNFLQNSHNFLQRSRTQHHPSRHCAAVFKGSEQATASCAPNPARGKTAQLIDPG